MVLVPLDHGEPEGEQIRIALKRLPARGEAQGTIFVNPGGPGEPGTALVTSASAIVAPEVLESCHVVGFGPRGVGSSTAVRCLREGQEDPTASWFDLTDEAQVDEMRVAYERLGQMCRELSGDLLDHVDSVHTARDLDLLRELVGDQTLTFGGYSYGTLIGATYAELFPERVGRMVLDGAIDPSLGYADLQGEQVEAFDQVCALFVPGVPGVPGGRGMPAASRSRVRQCGEVVARAERLDAKPIPSDADDGELAGWELLASLSGARYAPWDWPDVVDGLIEVYDGTALDEHGAGWSGGGTSGPVTELNAPFAFTAIDCTDYPMTATYAEAVANARDLEEVSACVDGAVNACLLTGDLPSEGMVCS